MQHRAVGGKFGDMQPIDLRSDTVTRPTPAMRQAMAQAEVGDDVYGEDPTVNRLEAFAAELMGFETALYMPSGTMTNQIALMLHVKRGHEVVIPDGAHIYEYEPGSMATLSGAVPRIVRAPYGRMELPALEAAIHTSPHQTPTGLIEVENTHNLAGGTVVPLELQDEILRLARQYGLPAHLDGARLFNAAQALGVPAARVAQGFDTVSICLSKGLGAPVGSLLLLPAAMRSEAWRYRKMLGGGMRQAGVLAAAGLLALQEGPRWLARDHQMAMELARGMVGMGLEVDLQAVQTNMVYWHTPRAARYADRLRELGLLVNAMGSKIRLVTHHDLRDEAIAAALECIERVQQVA